MEHNHNKEKQAKESTLSPSSYQFILSLLILADILVTVVISVILSLIMNRVLGLSFAFSLIIWPIIISLVVGSILTFFVSKIFLSPMAQLSRSMRRVAGGNFSIYLDTKSKIHEIRDIYNSFNLMVRELSATEILQTDFVSNVSHEIKTPINAIEGYTTLLQDSSLTDEERQGYTDKILYNTERLSELVGNILLLSRIDSHAIQAKPSRYRLDEQIRASIVLLEPKWSEKNIDFDVELDELEYIGNEGLLHHVWNNLIGNAIKFDPVDGFIRIRLKQVNNLIVFTIDDNGPGIPAGAQNHVFEKFYQSDSSHKSEGNGLGLALVKHILDVSGGSVSTENLPEGGCRFTVVLR